MWGSIAFKYIDYFDEIPNLLDDKLTFLLVSSFSLISFMFLLWSCLLSKESKEDNEEKVKTRLELSWFLNHCSELTEKDLRTEVLTNFYFNNNKINIDNNFYQLNLSGIIAFTAFIDRNNIPNGAYLYNLSSHILSKLE